MVVTPVTTLYLMLLSFSMWKLLHMCPKIKLAPCSSREAHAAYNFITVSVVPWLRHANIDAKSTAASSACASLCYFKVRCSAALLT